MRKSKACLIFLCVALLAALLAGCGAGMADLSAGFFSRKSLSPGESLLGGEEIAVTLSDSGSRCNSGEVVIDGGTVTVTAAGDYLLSGSLSDGQIVVDAPEDAKVKLILNGVSVIGRGRPAVYARSAGKLVLSSAAKSENLLQSTGEFAWSEDDKADAAVFARCDLTLSGEGVLNISALCGHAVVSKDDLKLKGGTVNLEAGSKGLVGKESVSIEGGTLNADVGTDGIYAEKEDEGTITITEGVLNLLCQKDGLDAAGEIRLEGGTIAISAGSGTEGRGLESGADIVITGGGLRVGAAEDALHAAGSVSVSGGILNLSCGDDGIHADSRVELSGGSILIGQSGEGVEGRTITVSGGDVTVCARDDGFNAAGGSDDPESADAFRDASFGADGEASLCISGGSIRINAEGDGLDSNGGVSVSGGTVYISGPTNSFNGALDYETQAVISGGTVLAAGAAAMAENFGPGSTQGSILLRLSSLQAGGSTVTLFDGKGKVLASFRPEKSYDSVLISTPELVQGGVYTIEAGDERQTVTLDELLYGSGMGRGPAGRAARDGKDPGRMPQEAPGPGLRPPEGFEGGFHRP